MKHLIGKRMLVLVSLLLMLMLSIGGAGPRKTLSP